MDSRRGIIQEVRSDRALPCHGKLHTLDRKKGVWVGDDVVVPPLSVVDRLTEVVVENGEQRLVGGVERFGKCVPEKR